MTATERRIRARPKLLSLVQKVAEARFVLLGEVCSKSRSKAVVGGRHECWCHLRGMGWSYPDIGKLWGMDHTTVLAALRGWE